MLSKIIESLSDTDNTYVNYVILQYMNSDYADFQIILGSITWNNLSNHKQKQNFVNQKCKF